METVGDRIMQILKLRGISGRELDRRSDLAEGHALQLVSRYRKNPDTSTEMPTLKAIAAGAEVSLRWLLLGEGTAESDDDGTPPSVSEGGPPTEESLVGWEDSVKIALKLEPELDLGAVHQGQKSARLFTNLPATPELVIYLAKGVMRFAGPDQLAQMRAEALARTERIRKAHDEHHASGAPLPDDVPRDKLTKKGRKLKEQGKLSSGLPPTYQGGSESGS